MSLQFVFGTSRSKKSQYMYEKVIEESMKRPEEMFIFIVPEQSTLLVQKELLKRHPKKVLENIDIISFQRLAYRVFDETKSKNLPILDDTGKTMILRKVAAEQEERLVAFRGNLSKSGFIGELKSMLSEFFQYGVTKEMLQALSGKLEYNGLLQQKIHDLEIVYQAFSEKMATKFITMEEVLPLLAKVIPMSSMVKNTTFIFDGFTGFTPVQYQLLEKLLCYSKKIQVLVTMPEQMNYYQTPVEHDLFYMSQKTVETLRIISNNNQIPIEKEIVVSSTKKGQKEDGEKQKEKEIEEFDWLEANIFRYPYKTYEKPLHHIHLSCSRNPEQEVGETLQKILQLIREQGYKYKDIAIICGDLQTYTPFIKQWFSKMNLPYFIDEKKQLSENPFVEFISSSLEVIEKDFSYESVFRYLRNPFSQLESYQVDILENYVIACGISGKKRWESSWDYTYKGLEETQRDEINEIRQQVMAQFHSLVEIKKEQTIKNRTLLLYQFLQDRKAEKQLEVLANHMREQGEYFLQSEYEQAYEKIFQLLKQLVLLLGDEIVEYDTYCDILQSGLEDIQVGMIPSTIDRLVVGDLMRTRLADVKALLFLGLNDGSVPKSGEKRGLISDREKEALKEFDIVLAPTGKEEIFTQKYYLYLMLTKPSMQLYLSYSLLNGEGKAIGPSYVIGTVKKIFPQLKEEEKSTDLLHNLMAKEYGIPLLIEGLKEFEAGSDTVWWQDLYSWYGEREEYKHRLNNIIDGLFYGYYNETLTKETARKLFGDTPLNSVTRLEKFASCEYAHFLSYGLGLQQRKQYDLRAVDYGNVFHFSIEQFFKLLKEKEIAWENLSGEERIKYVKESVEKVINEYGNTIFKSSARNQYLAHRLEQMTDKTIWALREQFLKGGFQKIKSEVSFSAKDNQLEDLKLQLEDGLYMALQGKIDRVDIAEEDGKVYVKIIDYKSGSTQFDLTKLYHGLQLQLMIYLGAAISLEEKYHKDKEVVPAGVYYYNMKHPVIETEQTVKAQIEEEELKELRMNGLSNDSVKCLNLLEKNYPKRSTIIKGLVREESGEAKKNSMVASTKRMKGLCQFTKIKATQLGKAMLAGSIQRNPYEYKGENACTYCEYASICGFDESIRGFSYRRLSSMEKEELWSMIDRYDKKEDV